MLQNQTFMYIAIMLEIYREVKINIDLEDLIDDMSDEQIKELIEILVDRDLVNEK